MAINRESPNERNRELHVDREDEDSLEEKRLLETVLRETMGASHGEALKLIFKVAKSSKYKDTTATEAVEEVVRAILAHSFGAKKFSNSFIHRVACSLIDTPEAAIKLERLWQEARTSG